jgi:hypothetical protein
MAEYKMEGKIVIEENIIKCEKNNFEIDMSFGVDFRMTKPSRNLVGYPVAAPLDRGGGNKEIKK